MDQFTDPAAWPPPPPTFPVPQQQSYGFPGADNNNNHTYQQQQQPQQVQQQQQAPVEPPPYPEMIITAITALKEKEGSSRQAIDKYIKNVFPNLTANHPTLLTMHLKKMKIDGSLALVKHSYALPGTVPVTVPVPENPIPVASATPSETKRRPGRPPKAKTPGQPAPSPMAAVPYSDPNAVSYSDPNAVPYSDPNAVPYSEPNAETMLVSLGLVDGPALDTSPTPVKRGRGRPPRSQSGPGSAGPVSAAPKSATPGSSGEKRGRGRPPRAIRAASLHSAVKPSGPVGSVGLKKRGRPANVSGGRGRGRPRKVAVVGAGVGGVGAGVAVKRRGRPPRAGGPVRKLRRLSGKPLGRPKKNTMNGSVPANQVAAQNLVAYHDLKNKMEHMQSRVKQAVDLVRPYFTSENAPYVYGALQELEELANMDMTAPPQAPPPEAQPEPQLPPVAQS